MITTHFSQLRMKIAHARVRALKMNETIAIARS